MVSETRRAAIRKRYRVLRTNAEKTQLQVEQQARLDAGRFWKIENGVVFPTPEERDRIARVLKVDESELPAEQLEAKAS